MRRDVPPETGTAGAGGVPATVRTELLRTLWTLVAAAIVALLVRAFVVETFRVQGWSMQPTLQNGERLLVDKLAVRLGGLHAGEIVVLRPPLPAPAAEVRAGIAQAACASAPATPEDFVKRIVAVGPATVDLRDGYLYVDGRRRAEPYLPAGWRDQFSSPAPVHLSRGQVYVLGDHRADSEDSRCFGPVAASAVAGVGQLIWWPLVDARVI